MFQKVERVLLGCWCNPVSVGLSLNTFAHFIAAHNFIIHFIYIYFCFTTWTVNIILYDSDAHRLWHLITKLAGSNCEEHDSSLLRTFAATPRFRSHLAHIHVYMVCEKKVLISFPVARLFGSKKYIICVGMLCGSLIFDSNVTRYKKLGEMWTRFDGDTTVQEWMIYVRMSEVVS